MYGSPKSIVEQQLKAMEEMKNRVEKYGHILSPEDKEYLLNEVEHSYKKCKIYLDMENEIEAQGLEPKPKKPTIPPTQPTYKKPEPKKKKQDVEQMSLLDFESEETTEPPKENDNEEPNVTETTCDTAEEPTNESNNNTETNNEEIKEGNEE